MEKQRIIKEYYKQLYTNKMDNLERTNKYLEMHNLPRLNQEEIGNMKRPITGTEKETVIKNLPCLLQKPRTGRLQSRILLNI